MLKPHFAVPNPKGAIAQSIDNLRALPSFLRLTSQEITHDIFDEDSTSLFAVYDASVPPYMVQAAIDQMNQIYEVGEEAEQKDIENINLMALTAFLFILRGLGKLMGAVKHTTMFARLAALLTELRGVPLGSYDLATDHDSLALGIFSFLLGFVGLKGAVKGTWKDASSLRRKMTANDIGKLGTIVETGLNKVSLLTRACNKL